MKRAFLTYSLAMLAVGLAGSPSHAAGTTPNAAVTVLLKYAKKAKVGQNDVLVDRAADQAQPAPAGADPRVTDSAFRLPTNQPESTGKLLLRSVAGGSNG